MISFMYQLWEKDLLGFSNANGENTPDILDHVKAIVNESLTNNLPKDFAKRLMFIKELATLLEQISQHEDTIILETEEVMLSVFQGESIVGKRLSEVMNNLQKSLVSKSSTYKKELAANVKKQAAKGMKEIGESDKKIWRLEARKNAIVQRNADSAIEKDTRARIRAIKKKGSPPQRVVNSDNKNTWRLEARKKAIAQRNASSDIEKAERDSFRSKKKKGSAPQRVVKQRKVRK
jgi:hypothetical protein